MQVDRRSFSQSDVDNEKVSAFCLVVFFILSDSTKVKLLHSKNKKYLLLVCFI
jgi:hypothetical protein